MDTTTQDPPDPTATTTPPTLLDQVLADGELDVDLGDLEQDEEDQLSTPTIPEGVEFVGEFESVEAYLRSMIEPEVSPACAWILDTMDWREVQDRFEADGSRLMCESGQVYRLFPVGA